MAFSDLFLERLGEIFSLIFLLITLNEVGRIDDSGTFLAHHVDHKESQPAISILRDFIIVVRKMLKGSSIK